MNYCLKALMEKGQDQDHRRVSARKISEYEELRDEIESLQAEVELGDTP